MSATLLTRARSPLLYTVSTTNLTGFAAMSLSPSHTRLIPLFMVSKAFCAPVFSPLNAAITLSFTQFAAAIAAFLILSHRPVKNERNPFHRARPPARKVFQLLVIVLVIQFHTAMAVFLIPSHRPVKKPANAFQIA